MRLMLAALVATAVIAIVAAVFAIWPAVADAPWEDEIAAPTSVPVVQQTECERLTQQLADAQTEGAARVIYDLWQGAGCDDQSSSSRSLPTSSVCIPGLTVPSGTICPS